MINIAVKYDFLKNYLKKDMAFDFMKPILLTSVWKLNAQLNFCKNENGYFRYHIKTEEWKKNRINNYIVFFRHVQKDTLPKEETFVLILK